MNLIYRKIPNLRTLLLEEFLNFITILRPRYQIFDLIPRLYTKGTPTGFNLKILFLGSRTQIKNLSYS